VSQDFIQPDSGDIPRLVHHKTQRHFSLKFCPASFFGKIGWGCGQAFGSFNTVLTVVVNLVVRDVVVGAAKLRFVMLSGISAKKEDAAQDGLRALKGFERLVEMDFYPLGLAEADENWLAIYFLVGECGTGTFYPQSF